MAGPEVHNAAEGQMLWIQASGTGNVWATASAAPSGVMGFVRSMTWTSGRNLATIMDRGIPNHHKEVGKNEIPVTIEFGWTGAFPTAGDEDPASVAAFNAEYFATNSAIASSAYIQFRQFAIESVQFTEGDEESTIQMQGRALGMLVTASGYLSS